MPQITRELPDDFSSISSAKDLILLSNGSFTPTRGVWCTVAGTADITMYSGRSLSGVAFSIGWHPISIKAIANLTTAVLYGVID